MMTSTARSGPQRPGSSVARRLSPVARRLSPVCLIRWRARVLKGLVAALAVAGCDSFKSPSELGAPQVIAVRAEPAQLAPMGRAKIELLVAGLDETPRVVAPDSLIISPDVARLAAPDGGAPIGMDAQAALAQLIEHTADGWFVVAPSEEQLALVRQLAGLAADAPVPVPVRATVSIDGLDKRADKTVLLGQEVANPTISSVTIDGAEIPMEGANVTAGKDIQVRAEASGGVGVLGFSWFSSIGEVDLFRSQESKLKVKKEPKAGLVLVVVRDTQGGIAWKQAPVTVAPEM